MSVSEFEARYVHDEPMQIIGIAGNYGAGKDEVGQALVALGFEAVALADPLKDIATALGWNGAKEGLADCPTCGMARGRKLLQTLGTEGVRATFGPDAWIRALERRLEPSHAYAVTDVRFANEVEWVHSLGGEVWRVDRPGHEGNGHVSEVGISELKVDVVIPNDGSIDQLRQRVAACLV